ncbi:hypothetical protein XBKQ1_480001 [Xenorhabdus bovienii str. kraussei Quebec]|uniref:Phage integrase central domain-containing protein n=1 Tax=Xenorhabdus bovienii str. kraussei Quebec TaxID=1398203 RepID=A0A077PNS1_XENBV|nr:hypothetical protein XBKQ1_480001 [Xenorhabdus bovienii str. kraussei Quebec]
METFEKDVFPYIGNRPIAEIKPMELMAVLSRMNDRGATEKLRNLLPGKPRRLTLQPAYTVNRMSNG